MPAPATEPPLIRICLDLNVWVADFLGTRRGRRGGSGPWLADAMRNAASPAGPLRLVVSFGMLDRLALVFVRDFGVEPSAAEAAMLAIGAIAALGPAGDPPYAVIGGGVYPIRDTEDRHVLEVAVAGEADVLATANLADFDMDGIDKIGDGSRVRIYMRPGSRSLVIAHPDQVRDWLRDGAVPAADIAGERIL